MKVLIYSFAISLGILGSGAKAEPVLTIAGENHSLATLTANCQAIVNDPAAQIACFSSLSRLLEEQAQSKPKDAAAIAEAVTTLQSVAEYKDDETGLSITATGCNISIVYFANYFHISRRNVSTVDVFSAEFDASKLQSDQTVRTQNTQAPLAKGFMQAGTNALTRGGVALDSGQQNFAPRSPRITLDAYAQEVVDQLQPQEVQAFDFPLVHPKRNGDSARIWSAFEALVNTCKG